MKFTDKYIQNLKPEGTPLPKRYYVRENHGFAVRVQPSGLKTFFFIYTKDGKRHHHNLGEYPTVTLAEARTKYNTAYNRVKAGQEPEVQSKPEAALEPQEDTSMHFQEFSDQFLKWSKKNHSDSWYKTNKLSLDNDVLPHWGTLNIDTIRRRDCIELLERVSHRSAGQVSNVHKAMRGVFDYALQRDYIGANPALKLTKVVPDLKNIPRDRTLSEKELKTIWKALEDTPAHRALKLILICAQRPGEVAGLHKNEIEGTTWTIPKERAEKGKGEHIVHLTKTALKLIGDIPEGEEDSEGDTGLLFDVKRNSLSQVVSRAKYFNIPRWTPHDLRRTARTLMAKLGVLEEHAEAVLNHTKRGMVKVYNKYEYQEEKRTALIKLEAEVLRIIQEDTTQETPT